MLGLTAVFHVPRNTALAAVDPHDPEAAHCWARSAAAWTAGNHVRTVAPLAAAVAFTMAAVLR